MMPALSPNTQAILLLTAPLIAGRGLVSPDLLSPGEYKRFARHLRELQSQPADLVTAAAPDLIRACHTVVDEGRLQRLLARGFLLSQVVEHWQARAIWVISRADAEYPRRLKARLREDAPAVLYGCGDISLLESGGLAVVGSRHVDDTLIDYTMAIGKLVAHSHSTIVSGGARGVDQAAMRGALLAGGKACAVLADSLEKTTMNRDYRQHLLDGQLTLISPFDPGAGFNVGHAMQRNKLIYALSDAALVVNSDLEKGGTWAGAVEQLDKLALVPIYVRAVGENSAGLQALRKRGALPWPQPEDSAAFEDVFEPARLLPSLATTSGFAAVRDGDASAGYRIDPDPSDPAPTISAPPASVGREDDGNALPSTIAPHQSQAAAADGDVAHPAAEALFASVREVVRQLLDRPRKEAEIAAALEVSHAQAKVWLHRLVDEGLIEKQNKPTGYIVRQARSLFE